MLDQLDLKAGLPWLGFLAFVLIGLLISLITGKVSIARTFTRVYFANRRDTPAGYWLFMMIGIGFAVIIGWAAAMAMGLDGLLPVGTPAMVEAAAPYAALLALAAYVASTVVALRRRRARLRAAHPSAVERASGGI